MAEPFSIRAAGFPEIVQRPALWWRCSRRGCCGEAWYCAERQYRRLGRLERRHDYLCTTHATAFAEKYHLTLPPAETGQETLAL